MDTDSLYEYMKQVEEDGVEKADVYVCSKGVPTIGSGYALLVKGGDGKYSVRNNLFTKDTGIFAEAGIDLPEDTSKIIEVLQEAAQKLNDGADEEEMKKFIDDNTNIPEDSSLDKARDLSQISLEISNEKNEAKELFKTI